MIMVRLYGEDGKLVTKGEVEYTPADFPLLVIHEGKVFYLVPGSNACYIKAPVITPLPGI